MSESTSSPTGRVFRRDFVVHSLQVLAAVVIAGLLTVLAIAQGWLPLCARAAGLTALSFSVVLIAAIEFIRRRPWKR